MEGSYFHFVTSFNINSIQIMNLYNKPVSKNSLSQNYSINLNGYINPSIASYPNYQSKNSILIPKSEFRRPKINLTQREKEVLHLISHGYTDIEMGKILFLASSTIKSYRKNLLQKFNARNSCHLVYLAK